jgi:hypothetical protein
LQIWSHPLGLLALDWLKVEELLACLKVLDCLIYTQIGNLMVLSLLATAEAAAIIVPCADAKHKLYFPVSNR